MANHINQSLFNQNLAAASLDKEFYFRDQVKLVAVELRFDTPVTETVSIKKLCAEDSFRDILLSTSVLDDTDNYIFHPCWDMVLIQGDKIQIQCTNANETGIVYGILHVERGS